MLRALTDRYEGRLAGIISARPQGRDPAVMRLKVIVLSLPRVCCLYRAAGGLLNAITSPPLEIPPAYNAPVRVVSMSCPPCSVSFQDSFWV